MLDRIRGEGEGERVKGEGNTEILLFSSLSMLYVLCDWAGVSETRARIYKASGVLLCYSSSGAPVAPPLAVS